MEKENDKSLMKQVQVLLRKRGEKAFKIAKRAVLEEKIKNKLVHDALQYFIEESWYDVQHPALLSLACEAVGGDPDATTDIGAALVLLAGAADIHDDIIDKSKVKGSKPTVFGKFGEEIAILAGDALLFKGLILLYDACNKLTKEQSRLVLSLVKQAFFEIGNAEAKEMELKKEKYNLTPEEYRKVIETKAAVAEMSTRIGAILGGGNPKEIDALGHYGKTLGILMTIRDDFIDLFEPDELGNRVKNECLPLPILYAFRNTRKKSEIIRLLRKDKMGEQEIEEILDLIMDMKEVQELKKEMQLLIEKEENVLNYYIKRNVGLLKLLLRSTLEDL